MTWDGLAPLSYESSAQCSALWGGAIMTSLEEYLAEIGRAHTHCAYCGRELIEMTEPGLFDTKSGTQIMETWKQCPRFARSWRNLWLGGCHDSFLRDNPVCGREWR